MPVIHKVYNLLLFLFPTFLVLLLSSKSIIPSNNNTLISLSTFVCEELNNHSVYAPKNFIVSFLYLLLPVFLGCTWPQYLHRLSFDYSTIETLILNGLVLYKTTTATIYYGFAVQYGHNFNTSSSVWLLLFMLAKSLSKIPDTDFGKVLFFWTFVIAAGCLCDPFLFNVLNITEDLDVIIEGHLFSIVVLCIIIVEFAYAKWVERRNYPNGFMVFSIFLLQITLISIRIDRTDVVVCKPSSPFQWLVCGRSLMALAVFPYFVGYRKQEQMKLQLVQNRFSEVSTQEDDQLI